MVPLAPSRFEPSKRLEFCITIPNRFPLNSFRREGAFKDGNDHLNSQYKNSQYPSKVPMTIAPFTSLNQAFEFRDGIFFPKQLQETVSSQKQRWDQIGQGYYGSQIVEHLEADQLQAKSLQNITGQMGGLWTRFPMHRHVGTILEIGCGYGRASLCLSHNHHLTCDRYIGIDLSEPLLRRLRRFKQLYDFYPAAEFTLICQSAESLPLESDSIDLVISNAVFMHIEESKLRQLLPEIQRVLKPTGAFVFNNSFHNRACPAHRIRNVVKQTFSTQSDAIYLKQYSAEEIQQLLQAAQFSAKGIDFSVEYNEHYMLLPDQLGKFSVPLAHQINQSLKPSNSWKERLAYSYNAYSQGFLLPKTASDF